MQEQSVFNRLGAAVKRPATSTTSDSDLPDDACEYAGVLQPSRVKKQADKPVATTASLRTTSVRERLGKRRKIIKSEGQITLTVTVS